MDLCLLGSLVGCFGENEIIHSKVKLSNLININQLPQTKKLLSVVKVGLDRL